MDETTGRTTGIQTESVNLKTQAGRTVSGALALPARTPAPAILLFHAFKGLTKEYKALALHYAQQGFVTLAADLYKGKVITGTAPALMRMMLLNRDHALDTAVSWVRWLRSHSHGTGKVATIGWCFGGAWSLNTSIATPVDATIVYYGNVAKSPEQLSSLAGPVLGHFGNKDRLINSKMVSAFSQNMSHADKDCTVHHYDADHAFANITTAAYDKECAALADFRTLSFLRERLGEAQGNAASIKETARIP